MSQSIQIPVTQVGLEQSIAAAMRRVGNTTKINLGTSAKQINALSQPLGRITGQADEFTKSMAAANARVLAFGASAGIIAGVSSAMAGLLASTIKVEKSLVEIGSVLNQSGAALDKFGQNIFNVAKNTGQSFDAVAAGALELARQGLNAEDTLERLNDALILSRLSGLDAAQSVEGLTAAFNSFKESGISTAEILNKVVAVSQKYAVSEKDLIEGLKRSASVAQQAGVSFDELAAVITAVQERTARGGSVIGNSFKTIFARIQRKDVLSDLQDLGVQVTDLQGNLLPALRILENLAGQLNSFSQIEQASIAEKLGGVFQLDKLLAALKDLSSESSVVEGALKAAGEAGNSAYEKNIILNQTLSSLLNKVAVSAEQLGAKLGEIGVTDSLKNVLGFFNNLLEGIQRVLGEESGLGNLVRGLVKGLGNFLAGPGLALFGAIVLKLSKDLVQFGFASLKTFFGIGRAAKEVQNVEGAISQILAKNVNLQQQLFQLEGNRAAQLRVITTALVEQEALLRRSASISSGLAAPLYGAGVRATGSGLRIGNSAGGYMPAVAKESKAIKQGVGGARAGDKPVVIPNFNFGGGKRGAMVAHTGEYVVPNFNGSGGSAVFNRQMVRSMGLPSGAKKIGAAGGFVPNFVDEANRKRNVKGLGAASVLKSIGFQGDESYDEIFKKIERTYLGSEVKWVDEKTKNAFNIFQNEKPLTSQAITISAVEEQRSKREVQKGQSVYDARQKPNSAVMLIPQNSAYNSDGLNVAFTEKKKVGGKIYDKFIGGFAGIQTNLSDTDEIKFSKISKIDESLRDGLSRAAFNILDSIRPGIKLDDTSDLSSKNIQDLLEKGGPGAFGALKGALFEGVINKVAEARGRNFQEGGSLDIEFGAGGEKSRTILETIFGIKGKGYDFADFKNSLKSKKSYIEQVMNYLPKDKDISTASSAAGGYIPNFAYQLQKSPRSDTRRIVNPETKSELNYAASESAGRGKYLDMVGIHSTKPGQGLELFKRLGEIARKSGRKVYSSSLLPQKDRIDSLGQDPSIDRILKSIYPQLSYRQKSGTKNTQLDFEFGEIEKTISGSNIFDLVKNEFQNVKSSELIKAIKSRKVGFSSVIDTFAGGYIPNFAAQRNVGYLDGDVLSDPRYAATVKEQIAKLGIKGGTAEYHKYLGDLVFQARASGKLKKFTGIYGVPGSGKSTMMFGGGIGPKADAAKGRKTNRIPIITPEDIAKVSEVVDTRASLLGTAKALEGGYLSNVDRMMILSSSTPEEQAEIQRRRNLRDAQITAGTSATAFGRTAGTSQGAALDSGYIEAMALSILGPDKVSVMGIRPDFTLARKKGSQLPLVDSKKIGLAYGAFSPSTKGHAELLKMAQKEGISPENFIAAVSKEGGVIDQNDPHSWRTALFPQGFRNYLMQKTVPGANVVNASQELFASSIPRMFEVSPSGSQRRFIKAQQGSLAFVGSDKTEKDLERYIKSGYDVRVGDRTTGISGTAAREAIENLDSKSIAEIFTKGAVEVINQYLPQMKNRSNIFPEIIKRVNSKVDNQLNPIEQALSLLPARKSKTTPPEVVAQMEELREARDKLKKLKQKIPNVMLRKLGKLFPDKYGLPSAAGGYVPNFAYKPFLTTNSPTGNFSAFDLDQEQKGKFYKNQDFYNNVVSKNFNKQQIENGKNFKANADFKGLYKPRSGDLFYHGSTNDFQGKLRSNSLGGLAYVTRDIKQSLKYAQSTMGKKGKQGYVYAYTVDPSSLIFDATKSENFSLLGYDYADYWNAGQKTPRLKKFENDFGNTVKIQQRHTIDSLMKNKFHGILQKQGENPGGGEFIPKFAGTDALQFGFKGSQVLGILPSKLKNVWKKKSEEILGQGLPEFYKNKYKAAGGYVPNFANPLTEAFGGLRFAASAANTFRKTLPKGSVKKAIKEKNFNPIFDSLLKFFSYPSRLIKSVDDLENAKKAIKLALNNDIIREAFAKRVAPLINSQTYDTKAVFQENVRSPDSFERKVENYTKYKLFGGTKDLNQYAPEGIRGLTQKGKYLKINDPKVQRQLSANAMGRSIENEYRRLDKKGNYYAENYLFGGYTGRKRMFKGKAYGSYKDRWDVNLNPNEKQFLKERLNKGPFDNYFEGFDEDESKSEKLNSELGANTYGAADLDSFILRELVSAIPKAKPAIFKGVVPISIGGSASGFIPNFANPLQAAVNREMAAGVPASQIYIDKNSSLKNAMNPMGLMVANRRDEPAGGFQGINRARREGANPMMYGAAGGFVPNYATKIPDISGQVQKGLGSGTLFSKQVEDAINAFGKKAIAAGGNMDKLSKELEATLTVITQNAAASKAVADEAKKQAETIKSARQIAAQEAQAKRASIANQVLSDQSNKKLAKKLDKIYLEYNKSEKTAQDLQRAQTKAAAILNKTSLGQRTQAAVVASTGSLAATRPGAQVGAGGNRDMLGTIFAVQGAMSALTGATEGATNKIAIASNAIAGGIGNFATASFAIQGLTQIAGNTGGAFGKVIGKLGPYGMAIAGITASYSATAKYLDEVNGVNKAAASNIALMSDAASKAAFNLNNLPQAAQGRIKKSAEALVSGAATTRTPYTTANIGGQVSTSYSQNRVDFEGSDLFSKGELQKSLDSVAESALGAGVSYDFMWNKINEKSKDNKLTIKEVDELTREFTKLMMTSYELADAMRNLDLRPQSSLMKELANMSPDDFEKALADLKPGAGIKEESPIGKIQKSILDSLPEEKRRAFDINSEAFRNQARILRSQAQDQLKSQKDAALDSDRSFKMNLSKLKTEIEFNKKLAEIKNQALSGEKVLRTAIANIENRTDLSENQKAKLVLRLNLALEQRSKIIENTLQSEENLRNALVSGLESSPIDPQKYENSIKRLYPALLREAPNLTDTLLSDQNAFAKKVSDAVKQVELPRDVAKPLIESISSALRKNKELTEEQERQIELSRQQLEIEIEKLDVSEKRESVERLIGAQIEDRNSELSFKIENRVLNNAYETLSINKEIERIKRETSLNELQKAEQVYKLELKRRDLESAGIGIGLEQNLLNIDQELINKAREALKESGVPTDQLTANLTIADLQGLAPPGSGASEEIKIAIANAKRQEDLARKRAVNEQAGLGDVMPDDVIVRAGENLFDGIGRGIKTLENQTNAFASEIGEKIPQMFSDNMSNAINKMIEGGESFGDVLQGAVYEFVKGINQANIQNLSNQFSRFLFKSDVGADSSIASIFGFASGGKVTGGSGTKDDVPAMLMGGEYVVNKKAVSKYGQQFLESINNGTLTGYAKGGKVPNQRGPQGNFYTPGTFGQGAIQGKQNLLDFATQTGTSGKFDKIINKLGFQSIDLEAESSRLSVSGMRNSPMFEATQSAKGQAFDLYLQQYNAEIEAKKQEKEAQKAFRTQLLMLAASTVLSFAGGAAMTGGQNAVKALGEGSGFFDKIQAFAGGIYKGGDIGGGIMGGGLKNLFSGNFGLAYQREILKALPISSTAKGSMGSKQLMQGSGFGGGAFMSGESPPLPSTVQDQPVYSQLALREIELRRSVFSVLKNQFNFSPDRAKDIIMRSSRQELLDILSREPIVERAIGGMIPSMSGIDTVPAMLSGGEFVMNRSAVQGIGAQTLQSMNSGGTSITSEETSKKLNEQLLAKLDELISASSSTGNITINVSPSGQTTQENSPDSSAARQQLARQIKDAVLQIINDEKRIGGSLRR